MRKSGASMEPFWDSKINKYMYVEYLAHASSKYLISYALLSLSSMAGPTFMCSLVYVILCIKKLACSIYSTHSCMRMQHAMIGSLEAVDCAIKFISVTEASRSVTIEVESRSQTLPLWLGADCVRTILTTIYHVHHNYCAATGDIMVHCFIQIQSMIQYTCWFVLPNFCCFYTQTQ
jgi:hypothetical protein